MTEKTNAHWEGNPSVGARVGLPEGYFKLGISIGSYFEPNTEITSFLDALSDFAGSDPALALVPRVCSHFTFLALAGHEWQSVQELPASVAELQLIAQRHLRNVEWTLTDLRLVPGNNFLLLAGFPNVGAQEARKSLATELKDSTWSPYLKRRYEDRNLLFPPLVWHTTLCRYQYERIPNDVRLLYQKFKQTNFGEVSLESPKLRAVNYDWSFAQTID